MDLLVHKAQLDLRERRDHVDQLELMEFRGQRDPVDVWDPLDHLVTQPRESSTEERKILTVSRTLRRCVHVY